MTAPKDHGEPVAGEVFLESPELGGAFGLAVRVDRVLVAADTGFHQRLHVVEAGPLGRLLILNNSIQTSSFDEPAYHEMLAHVPLLAHPDPRRVLVVGGGDGGTLREVARHPSVEAIDICEIDADVIDAAKAHLPELAKGFDDPRVNLTVGDGIAFVAAREAVYDVILVDSSDPEGPATGLFNRRFYEDARRALRPGGLLAAQGESFWLFPDLIRQMFAFLPELFPVTRHYLAMVPTYLSGVIGFTVASLGPDPMAPPDPERLAALGSMAYYTPAVHRAAFALPRRCLDLLPDGLAEEQGRIYS